MYKVGCLCTRLAFSNNTQTQHIPTHACNIYTPTHTLPCTHFHTHSPPCTHTQDLTRTAGPRGTHTDNSWGGEVLVSKTELEERSVRMSDMEQQVCGVWYAVGVCCRCMNYCFYHTILHPYPTLPHPTPSHSSRKQEDKQNTHYASRIWKQHKN